MHRLRKRNKRLEIYNHESGETVYTPPDFLRVDNRGQLEALARQLDEGVKPILAIMDFESSRPSKKS